ncbi:uncharacterized protein BO66DRAFT_219114 [Aspergillus aculeatinus CBS 121060]|uniref:Uncharacterized protein n=1 Tax=Aspergillus aculeatinus CBS 121060 TaxID=1448322 RepID=A0ACD1GUN7_9EURO|nr:hypothetical protein BO66DRAFT_219114 [Aspergillus aculeatinus CBS 121060]RAH65030.1 hypothetical protein BO66DRAFT_219114 [Aspergillus aculeatinus CBS 121060]
MARDRLPPGIAESLRNLEQLSPKESFAAAAAGCPAQSASRAYLLPSARIFPFPLSLPLSFPLPPSFFFFSFLLPPFPRLLVCSPITIYIFKKSFSFFSHWVLVSVNPESPSHPEIPLRGLLPPAVPELACETEGTTPTSLLTCESLFLITLVLTSAIPGRPA